MLFDIETAPIIAYVWAMFQEVTSIKSIRRDWFVLCWSAKWLGEKKIFRSSLPEFRGYKELPSRTEKGIDKEVMKGLWELLDECDIAMAHNLKGFDRKKANTRFLIHGMPPPSHYQLIDTLTEARKEFKFTSNKLAYISKKLGVLQKMDSGGIEIWEGCESGEKKAWKHMIKYCDIDVRSLEEIYLEMRPYMKNHPYLHTIENKEFCDKSECKGKGTVKDGIRRRNNGIYQKLRCIGCGDPLLGELVNA